jgi:hypothetical protein
LGTAEELRGLIKALTASGAIESLSKRLSKANAA